MLSPSLLKVAYPPRRRFNVDIKVCILTLTALKSSSGGSSGFDHSSCVIEIPEVADLDENLFDTISSAMPYTMRLFNTTIMVLEYNFPSTAEVVSKYAALLGIRNKTRLVIARAAVQVENVIKVWRRGNNESDLLTGQHPRLNNQARYFANQLFNLFRLGFPLGKL